MNNRSLKKLDIIIIKYFYTNNFNLDFSFLKNILNISKSNIRLSVDRINNYLIKTSQGSCYIKKERCYLKVSAQSLNTLFSSLNSLIFSSRERQEYILADLIFKQRINLNEYIELFDITRTTISSDIKEIKIFLTRNNLQLDSVPFKGIFLIGTENNKIIFSIKYILKLIIEKDNNIFSNKIYYKYITKENEDNFNFLSDIIIKILEDNFNLRPEFYYFKSILAIIIYLNVTSSQNIFPSKISVSMCLDQMFIQVKALLLANPDIRSSFSRENSIDAITLTLLGIFPNLFLKTEIPTNAKHLNFISELQVNFEFNIDDTQSITILKFLRLFEFKKEFNIFPYWQNNFDPNINSMLFNLSKLLKKHSIDIFSEDVCSFAIFLKHIICKNKKILILDISPDSWIGKIIKMRTQAKYPGADIELKNVSHCSQENIIKENPDLILYINFNFSEFYPNIQIENKVVFL